MTHTKFVVPYRRWRYVDRWMQLIVSREAKRLFKFIEGKTVTFRHEIMDNKHIRDGVWYDKITVTVERTASHDSNSSTCALGTSR